MAPKVTERDNFFWLLIVLVLLLMCDALFSQLELQYGGVLVSLSLLLTLFVFVWSLDRQHRKWRHWKMGITFVVVCLVIAENIFETPVLALGELLGYFIFLSLSLYLISKQVLFTGNVDGNKIIGAICIYILLGLLWAFAYLFAEELFPGSFSGLKHGTWQANLEQFIYYSMVTLTTIGYGDITPEQSVARFLAYMEGITSIFYTAILVASLIGVRMASYSEPENENQEREN